MAKLSREFLMAADGLALDENIRTLIEVNPSTSHTGLLRNYYDELDDYHRGAISRESFKIAMVRLRDSFLYFTGRLKDGEFTQLNNLITGQDIAVTPGARKMLYVCSSPKDEVGLQVDFEFRSIQQAIQKSSNPGSIELIMPLFAATIEDFTSARYREKPSIIHFSGHGEENGLLFSDVSNNSVLIPSDLVTEIFKGSGKSTDLVFLNACCAAEQAAVISKAINYVIGTTVKISDDAAILVSENYYRFLGDGQSMEDAFNNARNLLLTNFRDEISTVVMWKSGQLLKN